MESYRFNLAILAFFASVLGLTFPAAVAEGKSTPAEIKTAPAGPTQTASEPNVLEPATPGEDRVMVTVDGFEITESRLAEQVRPQLEQLSAQAGQLPPEFLEQYKQQLRQQATETLIIEHLLSEKVKENGIEITDQQAEEKIKEIAAQQNLSLEDFKALVEAYGQDLDQVKQRMRKGLAYEKILEAQWAGKIDVNDADAKKYYDENTERFKTPEQIRASHILIKTEPNDSNDVKAGKRARVEDLLRQIKDGADFAELARNNSQCPSAAKGGDLGFFGRGQMVPAFEQAALGLKIGQVSGVVETRFGYHIIKLNERKEAGVTSFEQAKDDILKMLTEEKKSKIAAEYVESLKAAADIVYPAPQQPPKPAAGPGDANEPAKAATGVESPK